MTTKKLSYEEGVLEGLERARRIAQQRSYRDGATPAEILEAVRIGDLIKAAIEALKAQT